MLKQRILSAIVLIMLVFAALFLFSPFFFALGLGAVVVLSIWEWTQFAHLKQFIMRIIVTGLSGSILFLWLYDEADYLNAGRAFLDYVQPLLLISPLWWLVAFALVITYPKSAKIWGKSLLLQIIFACVTLLPFLVATIKLRLEHYVTDPYLGIGLLLYVFILVWAADSGAYFAGRKFGKHKLAPKVSPGKTWQGVIGGLCTATILAWIFLQFTQQSLFGHVDTLPFILLSIATVAVSILGDLVESMFKREAGIKDSSNLIPGHGGVLDRIDSLTAAVPVFAYFYFFVL